jgi:thiamine biosynthesis lipoprotein
MIACISALLLVVLVVSCSTRGKKMYRETRVALYTVVTVTVYADDKKTANTAIESTFAELDRLGKLLNFYSDDSEISLVNRHAGIQPAKVSKDTIDVVRKALHVAKSTEGAFDPTIGPIVRLWDFEKQVLPGDAAIKEKLPLVNYKKVVIDEGRSTVFLREKGMAIDLGGVAKGYAADRAVEVLKKNGITAGIVAVGGEVKPFGTKPDGEAWRVGIKNPDPDSEKDDVIAVVKLSGKAISTSGGYEKFFVKDGKTYHHILDPATGYPVYECRSVSIIADSAPDGFPTGIFVLGPQKGMEVLRRLGLDAVIIDKDGNSLVTEGIKDNVEFIHKKN